MSKIINFEFYYLFIIVIFSRFITSTFMAGGTTVRLSRVGVLGYSLLQFDKESERERTTTKAQCASAAPIAKLYWLFFLKLLLSSVLLFTFPRCQCIFIVAPLALLLRLFIYLC